MEVINSRNDLVVSAAFRSFRWVINSAAYTLFSGKFVLYGLKHTFLEINLVMIPFIWFMISRADSFIMTRQVSRAMLAIAFVCFSRIKKLLGRTETRTHERMYYHSIRTV